MSITPPSTRLGTILIMSVFIGLGLLDNLLNLFICLVIINLFALLVVRSMFITAWRCKGILVFFCSDGRNLALDKGGAFSCSCPDNEDVGHVVMEYVLDYLGWVRAHFAYF